MSGAAVDRHDDDDYCVPEACQRPPQWDCFGLFHATLFPCVAGTDFMSFSRPRCPPGSWLAQLIRGNGVKKIGLIKRNSINQLDPQPRQPTSDVTWNGKWYYLCWCFPVLASLSNFRTLSAFGLFFLFILYNEFGTARLLRATLLNVILISSTKSSP